MTQIAIAFFGLLAVWMAMGHDEGRRRYAPLVGLAGQPAWLFYGWQADAWGLLVVAVAYTFIYAWSAWEQWR